MSQYLTRKMTRHFEDFEPMKYSEDVSTVHVFQQIWLCSFEWFNEREQLMLDGSTHTHTHTQ